LGRRRLAVRKKKSYNSGRDFEYKVRDFLKQRDWIVKRAYASKGIFDLLAYKDGLRWGIQAKSLSSNKNKKYLVPKENRELCEYAMAPFEEYEFVCWNPKYRAPVMQIIKEDFTVIHAYNKFPGIGWRRCNSKGEWVDFEID
jgi:Holliday junction resolvase